MNETSYLDPRQIALRSVKVSRERLRNRYGKTRQAGKTVREARTDGLLLWAKWAELALFHSLYHSDLSKCLALVCQDVRSALSPRRRYIRHSATDYQQSDPNIDSKSTENNGPNPLNRAPEVPACSGGKILACIRAMVGTPYCRMPKPHNLVISLILWQGVLIMAHIPAA